MRYVFGEATPVIICAPLRICDLALEPGENVKDVLIGDSVRWSVEPAISGTGKLQTTHAVIKTQDVGLATNLMITTDRRTYHLTLKSASQDHMPYVSFTYPTTPSRAWANLRAENTMAQAAAKQREEAAQKDVVPGIGLSVNDLNFGYEITGSAPWKPSRVFDDGVRTYIELPDQAIASEVPIILVPKQGKDEVVNYRLKDNRYVVDSLLAHLILVQGIGREQQRVHIRSALTPEQPDGTTVAGSTAN